ncbi:odorant receptor 131-2-like [Pygocentrus nattereri]|uniref:odorant receptor 131-2-like n=1 Tax=Pygocentrus nattereri TaxID=42514 RepID=UPI000814494D|nr:odorant receptor 131-2-like [Pygocentrus nattereri]
MAVSNESTVEVVFIHQQMFTLVLNEKTITKYVVVMLLPSFFIYVNGVMLFALRSKRVFKESPRYILFAHMLFTDSVHLFFSSMLYCFALVLLKVVTAGCAIIVFVSGTTFFIAPLNLAVMSLERYVAIHFPLRHTEIATRKRTYIAIILIWCISSINVMFDVLLGVVMDRNFLTSLVFCTRERLFIKPWQLDVYYGFNTFYLVSVTLIIIFTYISIMITARSVSSNKDSAKKAYRTVLLHFIQLCLCLTAFLYSTIERAAAMLGSTTLFLDLRYLSYLFILVLPRCLSPLIYGLRDEALRPLFIYYFHYGKGKIRPVVNVQ